MTVPACTNCNGSYSADEMRVAAVVCTVSFLPQDREAVDAGGWIHSALQGDRALNEFVMSRLGPDGVFRPDVQVLNVFSRVIAKTTAGLLFHEFGRQVPTSSINVIAVDHAVNTDPLALVELHRRDDSGWAEVTPSGRVLERQVQALYGQTPRDLPNWRVYIANYFEYMFIRRSNNMLLTAMKLHNALTALAECPWPNSAGPRRGGRPPKPSGRS